MPIYAYLNGEHGDKPGWILGLSPKISDQPTQCHKPSHSPSNDWWPSFILPITGTIQKKKNSYPTIW